MGIPLYEGENTIRHICFFSSGTDGFPNQFGRARMSGMCFHHHRVAAGVADEVQVQVAYAIGIAEPVGLYVNTFGSALVKDSNGKTLTDSAISRITKEIFDMRPYAIIKRFGLRNPIFTPTASYGHFGRDVREEDVEVYYSNNETFDKIVDGKTCHFKKVKLFAWEALDYVDNVKKAFGL